MGHRRGHYIPQNAGEFGRFMKNIAETVARKTGGNPPQWGRIPPERVTALAGKYAAFNEAYLKALAVPAHANIVARQEAQAEATRELREFVNQFLRFPPVTDPERAEMGVPNRSKTRTGHVAVPETVEFEIRLKNIRELIIDFKVKGSDGKAKPDGYDGAFIAWGVRDSPPSRPEDLERRATASRTPFALEFGETERGKTVYIAAAWQNKRGILGAYSEYQSAVIP